MDNKTFICGMAEPETCLFTIEGGLSIPETMPDICCILAITATASTDGVSCNPDGLTIDGKAYFQILYCDEEGIPRSFDAECAFSNTVPVACSEDASACVIAKVGNIAYKETPRRVDMRAELMANVVISQNESHCTMASDCEDIRTLEEDHRIYRYSCAGKGKAYADGKITIPGSMPEVKDVLLAGGTAHITDIHKDIGRVAVEGEVKLSIIYSGTDKNAPIQYMNETVPFSQIIPTDGEGEPCVICAPAKIFVATGEEADTLDYSCIIDISVIKKDQEDISLIRDAYSMSRESSSVSSSIITGDMSLITPQKRIIRTGATIPDMLPEASRVLCCMVTPEVTSLQPSRGSISLSGKLHASICYTTASMGIRSAKLHLPFETELSASVSEDSKVMLTADCEYAATEGSGRELELRACLIFSGMAFSMEELPCISDINLGESIEKDSGILLYFADDHETDWDILRRFHTDPAHMRDMGEGRKMMIL